MSATFTSCTNCGGESATGQLCHACTPADVVRRKSSQLEAGDVVRVYGMRVQLGEMLPVYPTPGNERPCYSWSGTVLNSAELPQSMGAIKSWRVQGNDLATWTVEVAS